MSEGASAEKYRFKNSIEGTRIRVMEIADLLKNS
jgi:hypothetical protein